MMGGAEVVVCQQDYINFSKKKGKQVSKGQLNKADDCMVIGILTFPSPHSLKEEEEMPGSTTTSPVILLPHFETF